MWGVPEGYLGIYGVPRGTVRALLSQFQWSLSNHWPIWVKWSGSDVLGESLTEPCASPKSPSTTLQHKNHAPISQTGRQRLLEIS